MDFIDPEVNPCAKFGLFGNWAPITQATTNNRLCVGFCAPDKAHLKFSSYGCGSKTGTQNATLVNETWTKTCGPIPGGLILTHTHIFPADVSQLVAHRGDEFREDLPRLRRAQPHRDLEPRAFGSNGRLAGWARS